jgi:arylsulfatase
MEKETTSEGIPTELSYTDKLISLYRPPPKMGSHFFTFAAYTSPHWPCRWTDEKYWKKYEGRYDDGYEVLKEQTI